MEHIVEAVKPVLLACISDRICDQTVNAVHPIEESKIFGCSSTADDSTVGERADERVPRQNLAADSDL